MRVSLRSILLTTTIAAAALPSTPAAAAVTRTTVDGPAAALSGNEPVEVDVAPDGTAAIAYRKLVGAVQHVFIARYVDGAWTAPQQADAGLVDQTKPSELPALAVGNGGRVVVAFANGTAGSQNLYAVVKASAAAPFGAPKTVIAGGGFPWVSPNIELAPNGNGYLTFYGDAGAAHLYAMRVQGDVFTPSGEQTLNQDPSHQATPGDMLGAKIGVDDTGATATVAWAEANAVGGRTVWARKITGTTPGPAVDATIPSFKTPTGVAHLGDGNQNNDVDVAVGGGTTWVAQHVSFAYPGGSSRGRTMVSAFTGTGFGPAQELDGIGDDDDNSEFAKLAVNASGRGLGVSYRGKSQTIGSETSILSGGTWGAAAPVSPPNTAAAARSTPSIDASGVGAVASYSVPTTGATPQVVGRIYGGVDDGVVTTLSDPSFGEAQPPYESGAGNGHAITAFVQQTAAGDPRIVAAVTDLPVPPTPPAPPAPASVPPIIIGGRGSLPPVVTPAPLTLTNLAFRKTRFPRGSAAPSVVSATSTKRALSLTLNRAATVTLSIAKVSGGRKKGTKCVAQTASNRKAKACQRLTPRKETAVLTLPPGTTQLAFQGTLKRGAVPPIGSYVLSASAKDAAGATAPIQTAAFKLTAAPRKTTAKR